MTAFKETVRAYREKTRVRNDELAERAGISPTYFAQVLAGRIKPSFRYVMKLARTMGADGDTLIESVVKDTGEATLDAYGQDWRIETLKALAVSWDKPEMEARAGSIRAVLSGAETADAFRDPLLLESARKLQAASSTLAPQLDGLVQVNALAGQVVTQVATLADALARSLQEITDDR
jgi:transcriptional regulator with XRE-family HTH domain